MVTDLSSTQQILSFQLPASWCRRVLGKLWFASWVHPYCQLVFFLQRSSGVESQGFVLLAGLQLLVEGCSRRHAYL